MLLWKIISSTWVKCPSPPNRNIGAAYGCRWCMVPSQRQDSAWNSIIIVRHEQEGKANLTTVDLTCKCEVLKGKPLRGGGKQIQSLCGSFYGQVGRERWARRKGRKNTRRYFLPLDGLCSSSRTITPIIIVIKSLHLKSIMTATEGTFPPLGII